MKTLNQSLYSRGIIYFLIVILKVNLVYAQTTPTQWKTNGNVADSNFYIGTQNNYPLKLKTNNIERFRITNAGNIGIGVSNPQAKMHIGGNVIINGMLKLPNVVQSSSSELNSGNSGIGVLTGTDNTLKKISPSQFQKLIINLSYSPWLGSPFTTCNPSDPNGRWFSGAYKLFTSCPDVNVGIGITNPRAKLDVIGITSSNSVTIGADPSSMVNDNFRLRIKGYNPSISDKLIDVSNTSADLLSLNNQGLMNLNGQLVIASNAANTKLSIVAHANNTRLIELKKANNLILSINEVGYFNLTGNIELTNNSGIPLLIKNSSTKILQLDNNGLLHARRIKVDTDNWADFVFEKKYQLMPLNELQTYINENKHLPNIPSENDVIENGVDLVEMNKLLLQKVEELTLYLLQQQKEIEELIEIVKQ